MEIDGTRRREAEPEVFGGGADGAAPLSNACDQNL